MAYTIVKTNGTVLTTISDGTINTTSTPLGLPGRNYAGYGQSLDTNFVHMLENFAGTTPPSNALTGQLWFNTNTSTLNVCPSDGQTNALAWLSLTTTSSGGNTTFGNVTITGNVVANNISATNTSSANLLSASFLTISANANIANANITSANIGTLTTTAITTGSATTAGSLTGVWTITGSAGGAGATAMNFTTGGIAISNSGGANLYGIKCDNYMYANGSPINFAGTYGNSNVAAYLPTYNGNILTVQTQATVLTTGANTTAGNITGNWTLTTGSRLQATYADLAERHHSDYTYPVGTVVKVGGANEITQVTSTLDINDVLGVVSDTAAYLMNATAGDDNTHPPIALVGRVKVRIIGAISKGDKIVPSTNGTATAASGNTGFGWALESSNDVNEKLILCVIK
jgi:hypothetical protein